MEAAGARSLRNWVPKQEQPQGDAVDLRCLALGPRGYKLVNKKRQREDAEDEVALATMDLDEADEAAAAAPAKRVKLENGHPYRVVSGKVWKAPSARANSLRPSVAGKSWEEKMSEKASNKAFQEQKRAAQQARKDVRKAKAAQKAAALERKKTNREKSQIVQKISNAATVKRMMKSKKQRKLLKTADTS